MKNKTIILISGIFILILGLTLGNWLTRKFKPIPYGMVLAPQEKVDSLNAYIAIGDSLKTIMNLLPDTVYVDTIIHTKEIVYAESKPVIQPNSVDSSIRVYKDSMIVEDEISAWVQFKVRGYMVNNVEWNYRPIIKEITVAVEKKIPYPVITNIEVPIPSIGNYLSLGVGGNGNLFIFGIDYDRVNKDYVYGLHYRRYGNVNVYGVKAGINLNTVFKR